MVVAILGKGMEIWNPLDGSATVISTAIPPEVAPNSGIYNSHHDKTFNLIPVYYLGSNETVSKFCNVVDIFIPINKQKLLKQTFIPKQFIIIICFICKISCHN